MCGLFGVVMGDDQSVDARELALFLSLGRAAQRRGSDASGIVRVGRDGDVDIVKSDLAFMTLARTPPFRRTTSLAALASSTALFGHSRLETHGFSATAA